MKKQRVGNFIVYVNASTQSNIKMTEKHYKVLEKFLKSNMNEKKVKKKIKKSEPWHDDGLECKGQQYEYEFKRKINQKEQKEQKE